jgi:phosphoglycerol transferase MdoB-like AlkP superfamily enzyme
LRATSLAELARAHGYHTLWLAGSNEDFHNKRAFESLHGTERFFGLDYFRGIPYEGTQFKCGYPDGPMLREALRIFEREARDGRPVFASVLTLSAHHPVSEVPEGPVPPVLRAAAAQPPAHSDYLGYLSRLRYVDESLHSFFEALFAGPLSDRALVVVLGDHGTRYRPHIPVAPHQVVELMVRIPFAIVTKHMPAPGVVAHPVHQIDVAPTVADVVGFSGTVAWVGRNVLDGPGSPWVVAQGGQLHYRAGDRVAYTLQGDETPTVYRLNGGTDPMLTFEVPRAPADPASARFFQSVAVAARQAATLNLVMPRAAGA